MVFPEGTSINGYTISRLINEGNTSTVYEALQVNLNRHVALKVIQKDKLAGKQAYIDLMKEELKVME